MDEVVTLYTIAPSYDSTLAVEIANTGLLRHRKHVLVFERFEGQISYSPENPTASRVELSLDPDSLRCRDKGLKPRRAEKFAAFIRSRVLKTGRSSTVRFVSSSVSAKPLRGYVVEGTLFLCGAEQQVRANVMLGVQTNGRFQIDADAPVKLSAFGIKPPSSLFGLIGTRDEAMIHMLLWAYHQVPVSPRA